MRDKTTTGKHPSSLLTVTDLYKINVMMYNPYDESNDTGVAYGME